MNDVTLEMLETLNESEKEAALACTLNHTKYQPTQEEFSCPKCGATCGDFAVMDSKNYDCPLIHLDDSLECYGKDGKGCPAKYGTTGQAFVRALVKKKNLVPCEHCKGKGYVPGQGGVMPSLCATKEALIEALEKEVDNERSTREALDQKVKEQVDIIKGLETRLKSANTDTEMEKLFRRLEFLGRGYGAIIPLTVRGFRTQAPYDTCLRVATRLQDEAMGVVKDIEKLMDHEKPTSNSGCAEGCSHPEHQ